MANLGRCCCTQLGLPSPGTVVGAHVRSEVSLRWWWRSPGPGRRPGRSPTFLFREGSHPTLAFPFRTRLALHTTRAPHAHTGAAREFRSQQSSAACRRKLTTAHMFRTFFETRARGARARGRATTQAVRAQTKTAHTPLSKFDKRTSSFN